MAIDLIGSNFDVVDATSEPLNPGDLFDLNFDVENVGEDDAGSFKVDFYLSTDSTIETGDILLKSLTVNSLAAGDIDSINLSEEALPGIDDPFWSNGNGWYYFGAIVDAENTVSESKEDNNSNLSEFQDSDGVPFHPVIGSFFLINGLDGDVAPGESVNVLFELENLAEVNVEDYQVDFYLSENNWITTGDFQITSQDMASLSGSSKTGVMEANLTLPGATEQFWRKHGSGTYHLGMIINNKEEDKQLKTFKNNHNGRFLDYDTFGIEVPPLADLAGESFSVDQDAIEPGNTIDVDYSIINKEAGSAGAFTVDFYLSTKDGEWISTNDYKLGSEAVSSLAGNTSTGNLTTSLTLPDASDEFWLKDGNGSYVVGMIVNPMEDPNGIDETFHRSNNANQGETIDRDFVKVDIPDLVDLRGQYLDVLDEPLEAGKEVEVNYAVSNSENGAAGEFDVDFYYSKGPYIGPGEDILLGSDTVSSLAGKSNVEGSVMLTLPETLTSAESGYIGMIVDGKKQITEFRERNNRNEGELIDFDGPDQALEADIKSKPDLVGQFFEVAGGPLTAGGNVDVNLSIYNNAPGDAEEFTVDIYASTNEKIKDPDGVALGRDIKLGSVTVDSLGGFDSSGNISETFTLPGENHPFWLAQGDGTYFLGSVIDNDNMVAEVNEDNNSNQKENFDSYGVKISNPSLVDLAGEYFAVPEEIEIGQDFDLEFNVSNNGSGNSGTFNVGFYVSKDKDFSAEDDLEIDSYTVDGGLAGNSDTGVMTQTYQLPESETFYEGDGTYYVGMIVDPEDMVQETEEADNSNRGEFIDFSGTDVKGLNGLESADLKGVEFNVLSPTVKVGEVVDVEYDIFNQGPGEANITAAGFYLFSEDHLNMEMDEQNANTDGILTIEDSPNAIYLFGDRDSQNINLGSYESTGTMTTTLEIPTQEELAEAWGSFDASKTYYLGLAADPYSDVMESDEFNNSLTYDSDNNPVDFQEITLEL